MIQHVPCRSAYLAGKESTRYATPNEPLYVLEALLIRLYTGIGCTKVLRDLNTVELTVHQYNESLYDLKWPLIKHTEKSENLVSSNHHIVGRQ
jgi:hypothetical protein